MNVKKIVPKSALNIKLDFGYISFEIFLCGNFEGGLMEDVYIMGRWCLPFEFAVLDIYARVVQCENLFMQRFKNEYMRMGALKLCQRQIL